MNTAQRTVDGNTLSSTAMPPIRIKVDDAFQYAGALHFILYDVAHVDVFLFVVAEQHHIRRLLIVQFEGYLDDNDYTYDYPITQTITLGAHGYLTDASAVNLPLLIQERPDSEIARIVTFLRDKGNRMADDVISQRFVRLVDEARRNEILLFYGEELTDTSLAADLASGGQIAQDLQERALASFTIVEG